MGHKAEIGWTGRAPDGTPREVCVHKKGIEWHFYVRARRYDLWQRLPSPPLEDWLRLLDAVQRRIARRRFRPEEEQRLQKHIVEQFPDAPV